jgi:NADPH:quinone reductase-like Zn-dependent oxidoreductase
MAQAAWLPAKGERLSVGPAERYKPETGEVLIKNHVVAINPVDYKMQDFGIFIEDFPAILGTDVAGVVDEIGEGVTNVKVGQRVLGHALAIGTHKNANGEDKFFDY